MKRKPDFLSILGLCKKAGKLQTGFDAVARLIASGGAKAVVTAKDLSQKSAGELKRLADGRKMEILHAPATMDEVERMVGRRAGVLAITDEGLAKSIRASVAACQEEESIC